MCKPKYKTCQVIMLSSWEPTIIVQHDKSKELKIIGKYTAYDKKFEETYKKLFFTSVEEIKDGDLILHKGVPKLATGLLVEFANKEKISKIIATSDINLSALTYWISEDFIESYANHKANEVQLELKSLGHWVFERSSGYGGKRCTKCMTWLYDSDIQNCACGSELKIIKDCVVAKPAKHYSREEVKCEVERLILIDRSQKGPKESELSNWIDKNL